MHPLLVDQLQPNDVSQLDSPRLAQGAGSPPQTRVVSSHWQPGSAAHSVSLRTPQLATDPRHAPLAPYEHPLVAPQHDALWQSSQVRLELVVVLHRGGVRKVTVAEGPRTNADLQQISPLQSELVEQVVGQSRLHRPLQHSSPAEVRQSLDFSHALGQLAYLGSRHSPVTPREGSIRVTVLQQISPVPVLQVASLSHPLGH